MLGDALVYVALAFAIVDELDGGAGSLGLVLAVSAVTRVGFTLVGGVWADRLPRRAVMVGCDIVRAVIELVVFALLLAGAMEVWIFAVTAGVFGAASAFFGPASTAVVAEVVPTRRLQQANALLSLSSTGAAVVGPAVAGVLVATVGAAWVFALDGIISPLPPVLVGVGAGLWFAGIVVGGAFWNATMQELIPREKLGRVDSYDWLISLIFQPLGFALAGSVAAVAGLDTTLLIAAVLSGFVHLAVLALPSLRAIRRADLRGEPAPGLT